MKTTHQNPVYPQTVEIPEPLEVHPSVSPLAAELLMKTAERIAANGKSYVQERCDPSCGSACCIIGHMQDVAGVYYNYPTAGLNRVETAPRIGLTLHQFERLFYTHNWPTPCGCNLNEATPEQGIARISHFLSTGQ